MLWFPARGGRAGGRRVVASYWPSLFRPRTIHGGSGLRRVYRIHAREAQLTTMAERFRVPPWGLFGGEPGQPFRMVLVRDAVEEEVRGKTNRPLQAGDVLVVETCGGGGYGPSGERPAEARREDEREGYLTWEGR